ncbi:MAG: hypothetical protein ACI9OJ_001836 [Myxococcota bacterium]
MATFSTTGLLALSLIAAWTPSATAQMAEVDHFPPLPGVDNLLGVQRSAAIPHLGVELSIATDYSNDALVGQDQAGDTLRILAHRATSEFGVAIGLSGYLDIGISLPVHLVQISAAPNIDEITHGIGNLRAFVKVALFDSKHVGLGLAVEWAIPTATQALMGDDGHAIRPTLILDGTTGPVSLALNVGARFRTETAATYDVTLGHDLEVGLAARIRLPVKPLSILIAATAARDQCPADPEDVDGFEDEDGCPDPDNDGDGVLGGGRNATVATI